MTSALHVIWKTRHLAPQLQRRGKILLHKFLFKCLVCISRLTWSGPPTSPTSVREWDRHLPSSDRTYGTVPQECQHLAYITLISSSLEYGATVWDPYLKQDVDHLERVQHQAAHFIERDYRTRETGCMGCMLLELNLPPQQECRKQRWLTTPYKTVEGHIPAMPPENFLMPAVRNWRRICPTTLKDCDSDNTIARHEICNTCGFKIPDNKTEQYEQSFFVRTVADWNKLADTVVTADTACSSAVGRVLQLVQLQGASPTHRQQEQKCF